MHNVKLEKSSISWSFTNVKKKKDVYSTWCSQAVTHLSTNHARHCLTSQIGRDGVCSVWYGRRRLKAFTSRYKPFGLFKKPICT